MQENTVFSVLNALNCNEHVEKKGVADGNLTSKQNWTRGLGGERPPVIGNREHAKAPQRNAEALACSLRGSNPRHPD